MISLDPLSLLSLIPVAVLMALLCRRLLGHRVGLVRSVVVCVIALAAVVPAGIGLASALRLIDGQRVLVGGWQLTGLLLLAAGWLVVACLAALVLLEVLLPSGSIPPLWRWPGAVVGAVRRGARYLRLAWIAARAGLAGVLRTGPGAAGVDEALPRALERAGVTFVKLGQILSVREDLVPASTARALARLQSSVEPEPTEDIERLLAEAWGAPPRERLARLEERPLGSASVGQVHGATLPDGHDVVIKVRRPGAAAAVRVDGDIAVRFAASAQRRFAWARDVGLLDLAEGLVGVLREELDYRLEASNTVAAARTVVRFPSLTVPAVYRGLSGEDVLVLERLRGRAVADLAPTTDETELAARARLGHDLFAWVLDGIVVDGFFHADLHPGNVMVLDDGRLGVLDFGAVGVIDHETRVLLAALLAAVVEDNNVAAATALELAFGLPEGTDVAALRADLGRVMTRLRVAGDAGGSAVFSGLLDIMRGYQLSVPGDVAGAFRTLASVEESLRRLDPSFDLMEAVRAAMPAVKERLLDAGQLSAQALPEAVVAASVARRLPQRVEALGRELETGAGLATRRAATATAARGLRRLADDALTAFFAAVFLVLAVVLALTPGGGYVSEVIGGNQVYAACFGLVAAALGLRVLIGVFSRRT